MDIGVIIQAPMQDEAWLKKCALMGLITFGMFLVPIVGGVLGAINMLGWMRTYADTRLAGGTTLPDPGLAYLGPGWRMFLMYLPIVGIVIAVEIVVFGLIALGSATHHPAIASIGGILGAVVIIPLVLYLSVMAPGILFLHIVKGEPWASLQFGKQWRLMMAGGTDYLLFWVAILVAGIIAELGIVACGVGLIVSMIYGQAMYGAAIAEFQRAAKDRIPA